MSDQKPSSTSLAWARLKKSVLDTEPQDLVKFAVFSVCVLLVYIQLQECLRKLQDPPVTTHSELTLNETISYPAITICREPPLNRKVYPKYNFLNEKLDPNRQTSVWSSFPFDKYDPSDFWNEAAYNANVILGVGLNLSPSNVVRTSKFYLSTGMCHTLTPLTSMANVGKKFGYTLALTHDLYNYDEIVDDDPGWHIYLHEAKEQFSENTQIQAGRQDHIFLHVGEDMEIRLDAMQFNLLRNCNHHANYSVVQCEENSWMRALEEEVACSGPWLPNLNKPHCTGYIPMRELMKATLSMNYNLDWCQRPCRTSQFKAYVVNRNSYSEKRKLLSTATFHFSTKTILLMEESLGYDWNLFLADLGGSVGFLLGLSVIGIIGILEQIMNLIFGKRKTKEEKATQQEKPWKYSNDRSNRSSTVSSTPTLVATFDRY